MMIRIVLGAGRALLLDEGGQTMLEYIVIIVFSLIVMIVFFRGVQRIVRRTVNAVSTSCDTD
jgi:Flp pilus assembly pilin Flp